MSKNFNINIALKNKGQCQYQEVDCKKCKIGKFLSNIGMKDKIDDLCDKDIVYFCAMLLKEYNVG